MKYFPFILLSVFLFFMGCPQNPYYENDYEPRYNDFEDRGRSSRCSSESLRDENLSLGRPDSISSRNAGKYRLSGKCSTAEPYVEITIAGASQEVNCFGGSWRTSVDITSIIQGEENVAISIQSGSHEVCAAVRNTFLCEDGYIPVSRLADDDDIRINYDFCVMQNEASRERGNSYRSSSRYSSYDLQRQRDEFQEEYSERAVSRSNQDPWTDISITEARRRCSNNGIGYTLISNDEWQVIARSIEQEPSNWFLERTTIDSGNFLNPGVPAYGSTSRRSSSRRDNRYHLLSNGEEIVDFGGGVWEMINDSTSIIKETTSARSAFELSGNLKRLFGPKRNYSNAVASNRQGYSEIVGLGLGGVYLSRINDIIARGGTEDRDVGVFAVKADLSSSQLRDIGFRCVYRP